jgi:hypothetical protein
LTQPVARVVSERKASQYVELFQAYLRSPAAEHQKILDSMGEVLSTVPSKPLFSSELIGLARGIGDMSLMRQMIRHQWHEVKRNHQLHHHRTIGI